MGKVDNRRGRFFFARKLFLLSALNASLSAVQEEEGSSECGAGNIVLSHNW